MLQHTHALHYCATHVPRTEDEKGGWGWGWEGGEVSEASANVGRVVNCIIVCNFTTFDGIYGWTYVWWSAAWWTHAVTPLTTYWMVWEPTQLVPRASQRSATVQPHTCALSGKKEQWTRCWEVRSLFQEDPQRLGHPLKIETKNKAGKVVHKIRFRICKNLFSYHNLSWTTTNNHVLSHNIYMIEDIASAALLASQAKQSGEPFPIHMLPPYSHQERRPWWRTANGALCQES